VGRVLLKTTLVALAIAACVYGCQLSQPSYSDGYRYGREGGPAGHVSEYATDEEARSECGQHAGNEGLAITTEWFRGCTDGVRHLPPAE
jgi:hypothetical protein